MNEVFGIDVSHHNGKIDWDNELFRIMPRIINSTSKKERNKHLLSWVKKYDNIEKTENILQNSQQV